jgi:hypothetical protein
VLALSGILMAPLPWELLITVFVATAVFALILDQIKLPVTAAFRVEPAESGPPHLMKQS